MNTKDRKLEIMREELAQRIKRMNELKVTVLNSHLTLERFVNQFLDASGKKYRDLDFAGKAELCKQLKPAEIHPQIWTVVTAANKLRNKIAHTLDHAEIQPKMDELRAAYLDAVTPTQAEGIRTLDDGHIAAGACELCGAHLAAAADAAQTYKKT